MYHLERSINMQRLWCKEMNKNPWHRDAIRTQMKKFEQIGSENFYKKYFVNIFLNSLQVIKSLLIFI